MPETEPLGVSIETLDIEVLPLVVVPTIGVTGIMLPRRSVNLLLVIVIWLQLVEPVHIVSPTLTAVT